MDRYFEETFKAGIKGKFTGSKPYFYAHYEEKNDITSSIKIYKNPPEKLLEDDFCAWGMMMNPKNGFVFILYQKVRKHSMLSLNNANDEGVPFLGKEYSEDNHLISTFDLKHGFFLSKENLTNIYETFPESETLFEGFSATIAPKKNTLVTSFIADDTVDILLNTGESMSFKEFAYRKRKPASFMWLEEYFNVFYIGYPSGEGIIETPGDIDDFIYVPYVDENVVVAFDI